MFQAMSLYALAVKFDKYKFCFGSKTKTTTTTTGIDRGFGKNTDIEDNNFQDLENQPFITIDPIRKEKDLQTHNNPRAVYSQNV